MLVDHLKKNPLNIHTTAKEFHDMWKGTCNTAARCISQAKEYNKKRYDKTHKEPDFREGVQVLVSTLNFNKLKAPNGGQTTEEFSRKHPVFPGSLLGPYLQRGEDKFPSRNKSQNPQDKVEVEDSSGPVKKIMKAMNIRLNGNNHRQYLVIFKHQTADKGNLLAEDAILDGELHLRIFRASKRA
ncbi:hypothetical protein O181_120063 [Austropuccinia psidii MF-1]|uniref:Uncharacterized protein n=1 Tax=Austropuccinia psidii MF-1 TaxID=1389203 RepID=A0A9Q3KF00_9BASI|nr:hypothetical protein [Austropuccinia psidii MF-1]